MNDKLETLFGGNTTEGSLNPEDSEVSWEIIYGNITCVRCDHDDHKVDPSYSRGYRLTVTVFNEITKSFEVCEFCAEDKIVNENN